MRNIQEVLNQLNPPIDHELIPDGDGFKLRLFEEKSRTETVRFLSRQQFETPAQFRIIVMYAVNELRGKSAHPALTVLPGWE